MSQLGVKSHENGVAAIVAASVPSIIGRHGRQHVMYHNLLLTVLTRVPDT